MTPWGIRSAKFCSTDPTRAWGTEIPWVFVGVDGWMGWMVYLVSPPPKRLKDLGLTFGSDSRNRGPAWSKSGSKLKRPGSCLEMCFGIEFWSLIWVLLHNSIMNRVCPFVSCTEYQAFGAYDILGLEYAIYAKFIARDALQVQNISQKHFEPFFFWITW